MKRFTLIAMICLFAACKKTSDTSTNVTVEYKYTADVSATYTVTYIDGNNNPVQLTYTGTSYSKTITANKSAGFQWAQFSMVTTTLPLSDINGDAQIIVNGKVANDQTVLISNGGSDDFSIRDKVFN